MATLLLIDDDPDFLRDRVSHVFPAPAHRVEIAHRGADGLERVAAACPDVILLDLRLPDQSGLDILRQLRRIDARIPVIMVTVVRSADSAIEAMRHGAYDYLLKPIDLQKLDRVITEAFKVSRLMREPAVVAETPPDEALPGEAIVGCCPAMQEAYKAIGRVADQTFPVLITGESGTGKELVARAIYQHGPRAQAPFLALNCAAIPENLLESELFGHEKGAFTGADRRRIGKFEQVSGGTLLLDEIGDMPPATQAKMLRVLQEQAFERVGGNETIRTDVRLIAATHRDLKAWSEEGKFRPDLYYRLGVFTVHLPPLRERGEDLPLMVRHFVRRFSQELGREVGEVAPAVVDRLRGYWPGNVRELQSALKQALLRATGPVLLPAFLPDDFGEPAGPGGRLPALEEFIRKRLGTDSHNVYSETHGWVDQVLLPLVMEYTQGNQSQAAQVLGIARQTLRQRLREGGLTEPRSADDTDEIFDRRELRRRLHLSSRPSDFSFVISSVLSQGPRALSARH